MTRAALRAYAQDEDAISVHEDEDAGGPQNEDMQAEGQSRPVLKDITEDNYSTTTEEASELKQSTPGRKPRAAKRKGRQATDDSNEGPEVTKEVGDQAVASNKEGGEQQPELGDQYMRAFETPAPTQLSIPGTCETEEMTAETPQRSISIGSKTPKFDPVLHAPEAEASSTKVEQQDSFIDSIKTRSPIKLSREPSPDSFIESIKSRSPARGASRIEDSVEAMDALEDAIEEVSIKMPHIEHMNLESPVKARQTPPKALLPSARKTAVDAKATAETFKSARSSPLKTPRATRLSPAKTTATPLKQAPPRTDSGRVSTVKPLATGPTITKSTTRPSTLVAKRTTTEAPKSTMSFSNSPLKTQPNLAKKRVTSGTLSTSRPAFVPAKSSKPPTKSSFALPGEAIQAKLKAQREERSKQEGEDNEKKTFKARPAPSRASRPSVLPRENKASLARKSSALTADGQTENKENVEPKAPSKPKPRPSVAVGSVSNTLDVKKRRLEENDAVRANSAVRRTLGSAPPTATTKKPSATARPPVAPRPAPRTSFTPRVASLTKPNRTFPELPDSAPQQKIPAKISGKEVYARSKLNLEREEREKREKEGAAKKARAEAAERGRQASRDWAEKQKRKIEAQKAASAANGATATAMRIVEAT